MTAAVVADYLTNLNCSPIRPIHFDPLNRPRLALVQNHVARLGVHDPSAIVTVADAR